MINRLISYTFVIFATAFLVPFFFASLIVWVLTAWFDRRLVILNLSTCLLGSFYLWIFPTWSVSVKGREKLKKNTPYMIVSNHQSQLDILIACRLFFPFKWVSKAEMFYLPFLGWIMYLNRYIKIKRGRRSSIREMLDDSEKALLEGSSLFFFPEGSRSENGVLGSFKKGAFIIAQKAKVPIIPVAINGTKDALPKHKMVSYGRHLLRLKVLDEIPYEKYKSMPADKIAKMVRSIIADHLDDDCKKEETAPKHV